MPGVKYDMMEPYAIERQSVLVKNLLYLYCTNGRHLAIWEDQRVLMVGEIRYISNVDMNVF